MSEKPPSPANAPQAPEQIEKPPITLLPKQEEVFVEAIGGQSIDNYGAYFAQKFGDSLADSLAKYGGYGAIRPVGEWSRFDGKTIKIELTDENILDYCNGKLNVAQKVKEIAFAK